MSIDAINDLDELNSVGHLKFGSTGDCNGRKVEILNQECALCCIQFETRQKDGFSFSNREIEPMMAKVTVKHKKKNGEENEVSLEVDTRKPDKPKTEKPKMI